MIKLELIRTKWNPANYKIYLNLGYIFTKMGDYLDVKSTDIPPKSEAKITAICLICKKERILRRCKYNELCLSCVLTERNKSIEQRKIASKNAKLRNVKIWANPEYEETRQKILSAFINIGYKNPNWNHNLTDADRQKNRETDDYKKWRSQIFERDNYICVVCSNKSYLNAHHLEGYHSNSNLRTDTENGITLCIKCHKDFHRKYSKHEVCVKNFIEWWSSRWN